MHSQLGLQLAVALAALALLPGALLGQTTGGGGGDVVDDTSPQIGADLDINEFAIADGDGDTGIELEVTADVDTQRFTSAGVLAHLIDCSSGTDCGFSVYDDAAQTTYNFNQVDPAGEVSLTIDTANGSDVRILTGAADDLMLGVNNAWNSGIRISGASTSYLHWNPFNSGLLSLSTGGDRVSIDFSPADDGAYFWRVKDTDTFPYFGTADIWGVQAGGNDNLEVVGSYVEVMGCRDYGTLTAAPTPNGACDRYYDDSGAFCVYNGATWDKIGSGTCV